MAKLTRLHSSIKSIPLAEMRVSNAAQRDLRTHRVDELFADFDLEMLGNPVVNQRDGLFWIVDGQHRVEALKKFLGLGWESQKLDCRTYVGMTEQEEADMFDRLNNQLTVSQFDKFKVRVRAGRSTEVAVKKIVEKEGLKITRSKADGGVSAVGSLVRVYQRSDAATLGRTLRIIHNSFGDVGLQSQVIDGVARVCERYNGALDDDQAIAKLHDMRGGISALLGRAQLMKKQTGAPVTECIAAAMVDRINAYKGGKKLASWWRE